MAVVIAAGFAGLLFGSFANVVVHRVPQKRSIIRPGSACPSCQTPLSARDNIPVLSWLMLRGKCRHCDARISPRYPIIELLIGGLFALVAVAAPTDTDLIAFLPFAWILVVLSFIDLEHKLLPNVIVLPSLIGMAVLLAIAALFGPGLEAWIRALLAGATSFAVFLLLAIISPRGMGMGDVKLAPVLGMVLGYLSWPRMFVGFFLAFLAGAVGGLLLVAAKRAGIKGEVPFGPYLAVGALISLLWGQPIVDAWLGV